MYWLSYVVCLWAFQAVCGVKVKVVMHSDEDDSKIEETTTDPWDHKRPATILPFLKKRTEERGKPYEEEKLTTDKPSTTLHPNEVLFPLIYKQTHINSMFLFGQNWYTWATEKRTDGSKGINYYICYEEPRHCDDVGWERTDSLPKCAFQIDSLLPDDRACLNPFGVEPHAAGSGACDGGEQMKVSEIVHSCGPRIRSLWRFIRAGHRPLNAAKPADVNSLICEDEEECVINVEYRIHHDRITFSLHEPSRGQTFKSALKRDLSTDEENKVTTATEGHTRVAHRTKVKETDQPTNYRYKKFHVKTKSKVAEGKGVQKDRTEDSGSGFGRRAVKNKIKVKEDISEDLSE